MKSFTYSQTYLYQALAVMTCLAVLFCVSFTQAQQAERPIPWSNARIIYVSFDGNDANSGLSAEEAVQTVERGISLLRTGQPDWLLLERGHDYAITQAVNQPTGTAPAMPMVIAAYGEGATPQLSVGPNSDKLNQAQQSANYIQVYDVTLTGLDNPFPILEPGSGWTDPTPQPDAVGTPGMPGYDAKAIARWDVVPYQTFDDKFHIGVVAFHMNGIDRVSFSVDGGPWVDIHEMQHNPRTDVWEYTVTLDASLFAEDGAIEVRAIAWPKGAGKARVLSDADGRDIGESSVHLFSNDQSTLPNTGVEIYVSPGGSDDAGDGTRSNPYGTITKAIRSVVLSTGTADGASINLLEGVYTYPDLDSTNGVTNRWLTLQAASNLDRTQVILTSPGSGISQRRLHVKNIRLELGETGDVLRRRSDPYNNHFWIDQCEIVGRGHTGDIDARGVIRGGNSPTFFTDVAIRDIVATNIGSQSILTRNIVAQNIGGDFINSRCLVVNASVEHMRHNKGVHADIVQVPNGDIDNMIVYGLSALDISGQGFAIGNIDSRLENIALVNAVLQQIDTQGQKTWIGGGIEPNHLLFWHITWVNYSWVFNYDGHRNLSIRNCVITRGSDISAEEYPGLFADNNHFIYADHVFGNHLTTGAPGWADPDSVPGDYRPGTGSILQDRVAPPLVPVDVTGRRRSPTTSIGAYD